MTLRVSNGRLVITDSNDTVLDTNDKMLHILDSLSGSVGPYQYIGGNDVGLDINNTVSLGSVPAACTQVIGAVKITSSAGGVVGLRFDRWHMVMGGSILWLMDGEPGFADRLGSNFGCAQFCSYHFSVSGGVVRLHRRVVIDRTPFEYQIRSHSIQYKLRVGAWT